MRKIRITRRGLRVLNVITWLGVSLGWVPLMLIWGSEILLPWVFGGLVVIARYAVLDRIEAYRREYESPLAYLEALQREFVTLIVTTLRGGR